MSLKRSTYCEKRTKTLYSFKKSIIIVITKEFQLKKTFILISLSVIFLSSCFAVNNKAVKEELKKYMNTTELEKLVQAIRDGVSDDIVIVDVRPVSTYNKAHIPTAVNVPNGIITDDQKYLLEKDLILYCETGGRVEIAKKTMIKNGFDSKRLLNFGGFGRYKGEVESSK